MRVKDTFENAEKIMKLRLKIIPLVFTLTLAGCSKQTAEELINEAQMKFDANQTSGAMIELKNAIQLEPNNPKARFLLGKSYVERGAAVLAEKELSLALELGYERNDVLPLLASAYNLQFKNQEIIKLVMESRSLESTVKTSLLLYQALAYFQLDKPANAKQSINQANEISTESVYSKLGNAYLAFSNKQLKESLAKTDEILKLQPDLTEAILLKGQLATLSKNYPLAVESFEKYQKLLPDMLLGRTFLANAYIKNKQFDEAEIYIDQLLKSNKNQPFMNQLKGLVRYNAKDFENAKLYTEIAIQNGLSTTPSRIIAGISSFQLKNYEQAYRHFSAIQDDFPQEHPIFKLIAIIDLELGYNLDAAAKLSEIKDMSQDDILLLSTVSTQLVRDGNIQEAKKLLEIANTVVFTDPVRIAEKGMMRLSLDDIEGITDLEKALTLNSDLSVANSALARAYIENGLFQKALELSETWIKSKPDEVSGYVLAAVANAKLNFIVDSETMFDKALSIDKGNPAANIYFANKAVEKNQTVQAIKYLGEIIALHPNYKPALIKYFVLNADNDDANIGIKPIEAAFNNNTDDLNYQILYAQALFTDKRYSKAVDILENVNINENMPEEYWLVLSNAYYFLNNIEQSLEITKDWVEKQPRNRIAHIRLITLYELDNNNQMALESAKKASTYFKDDSQISMLVTNFYIGTNDIESAEKSWNLLPLEMRKGIVGQGLLGQIKLENGQPEIALPLLTSFYQLIPNNRNTTFLAKALIADQKNTEAFSFLREHQLQNGESSLVSLQIAELAIADSDFPLAIMEYKKLLAKEPNNQRALNNLAFLLVGEKNYPEALEYAERAYKLSPNNPSILDTFGLTLLKKGSVTEAVKYFEKAYVIKPKSINIALHYAEALIKLNRKREASIVLARVTSEDPKVKSKVATLQAII